MTEAKIYATLFWLLYLFSYNSYFGNNWSPRSAEECICDGIASLIIVIILVAKS